MKRSLLITVSIILSLSASKVTLAAEGYPIKLLPRTCSVGKSYTVSIRYTDANGYLPVNPQLSGDPIHLRTGPAHIYGADVKSGVIITWNVKTVIPSDEHVDHRKVLYNFLVSWGSSNGFSLPPGNGGSYYVTMIQGLRLHLKPLTAHSLVGRWRGRSNEFEFLSDGTVAIYKLNAYPASLSGTYSMIGSNRLKITAGGQIFLYKNVSVTNGNLNIVNSDNGSDTLQRVDE